MKVETPDQTLPTPNWPAQEEHGREAFESRNLPVLGSCIWPYEDAKPKNDLHLVAESALDDLLLAEPSSKPEADTASVLVPTSELSQLEPYFKRSDSAALASPIETLRSLISPKLEESKEPRD